MIPVFNKCIQQAMHKSISPTIGGGDGPTSVEAKSVVFDIADTHDGVQFTAIRSIEFLLGGEVIPVTSGYTAYATTTTTTFVAANAFNTSQSKVGNWATTNSWVSANGAQTNQRLIAVFDTPIEFDAIVVNNGHNSGNNTSDGANNVVITISDDEITSTVYEDTITSPTVIFDGVFPEHVALNQIDDQEVWAL